MNVLTSLQQTQPTNSSRRDSSSITFSGALSQYTETMQH